MIYDYQGTSLHDVIGKAGPFKLPCPPSKTLSQEMSHRASLSWFAWDLWSLLCISKWKLIYCPQTALRYWSCADDLFGFVIWFLLPLYCFGLLVIYISLDAFLKVLCVVSCPLGLAGLCARIQISTINSRSLILLRFLHVLLCNWLSQKVFAAGIIKILLLSPLNNLKNLHTLR